MIRRHSGQGARLPARSSGIFSGSSHCGQLDSTNVAFCSSLGESASAAAASASRSTSGAGAGGGAAPLLPTAARVSGTRTGALHLLHLPRFPARESGTVILALQAPQENVIDMVLSVIGPPIEMRAILSRGGAMV